MSTSGSDATPGAALQYSYMFETNNAPTKQLDALLRAIARHIVSPPPASRPEILWLTLLRAARSSRSATGKMRS